ncbi:MAG: sugar phosphate nucleotidyltransferase [Candidatus Saccharimonadales bacterium]
MAKVTKAVIAAAGFGSRFLPQTKAMPKEMLPLIDKPIIQYIVEQLVEAGIEDIIIVGSGTKRSIEDHFDEPNEDLLANLRAGGPKKKHYIDEIKAISRLANFVYLRQKGPYGTATPIMNAQHLLGNESFIYAFADDLSVATPNVFQQMIALHKEFEASILPCIKVTEDIDFARYGILSGKQVRPDVIKMDGIIEKPGKASAPSNFASVGGYLFTPDVFGYIKKGLKDLLPGKEFYVSDNLIQPMLKDGKSFYGCEIQNSKRYDTGDKLEYLKTVIDFGLKHPDLGPALKEFIKAKKL